MSRGIIALTGTAHCQRQVAFLKFCTLPGTTSALPGTTSAKAIPSVAHIWCSRHPTLSGTLVENPTLCGTEIGQNGTLAVLAYE